MFEEIKATLVNLVDKHGNKDVSYHYIPLSALYNENVVSRSEKLDWHKGEALIDLMEAIPVESNKANDGVFQIQYVIRPKQEAFHDYRGFAGNVRSGVFSVGNAISIHPSGRKSIIKKIEKYGTVVDRVSAGENATLLLVDEIDASRGDSILNEQANINRGKSISATFCWMQDTPLSNGNKYWPIIYL